MEIPPKYSISQDLLSLIAKIEAERLYFSSLNLEDAVKENIQRVSLLKSSLFSARIEGNPLKISDFEVGETEEEKKKEIFNIVNAVKFIDKNIEKSFITKDHILHLHSLVLRNISPDAGRLRTEISAIFNESGVAVYMPPPPTQVLTLLNKLLAYVNSKEKFPLIIAFAAHLVFEKIHPFLDGNGRVGRLLISAILKSKGWDFSFTVPFEEYLDEHKDEYYFQLSNGLKNTNSYLEFMLSAFYKQIEKIRNQIAEELLKENNPFLPPRQEEMLNIIKDQVIVSFDMIRRRFLQVPERTLRYDLKKLFDKKLIEKSGETRGRYYRVRMK
ncbi:MAG: Fic family protein [Candidatus Levybacteria bacterium]|nr:Fic family protein [Candidatus Levybacteria bacterium]